LLNLKYFKVFLTNHHATNKSMLNCKTSFTALKLIKDRIIDRNLNTFTSNIPHMKVTRKDAMRKSGNESNKKGQFGVETKQSQSLEMHRVRRKERNT